MGVNAVIKWADYLITNIKYINIDGKRYIDEVKVYKDNKDFGEDGAW